MKISVEQLNAAFEDFPEFSENTIRRATGSKIAQNRPEVKAKKSLACSAYNKQNIEKIVANFTRPDVVEKRLVTLRSQEVREKVSNSLKQTFANPEVKAKLSQAIREANARPETKAKVTAGRQAAFFAKLDSDYIERLRLALKHGRQWARGGNGWGTAAKLYNVSFQHLARLESWGFTPETIPTKE